MLKRFWLGLLVGIIAGMLALGAWWLLAGRLAPGSQLSTDSTEATDRAGDITGSDEATIKIMVGGDVMLGRYVERQIDRYGSTWPFDEIAERMAAADLTLINLESPLSITGTQTPDDSLILRGEPKGVDGLVKAGVDFAALANNHIPDMGYLGLSDTKTLLGQNKILFAGAGDTKQGAHQPAIFERAGQRIAVLSYTYGVNFDKPGVIYAPTDAAAARSDIEALNNIAIILVMVHFGQEYAAVASQKQRDFAHALIDAGASAVIGSHPHVPQPVETYKDKPIFYSLGNLVFDQAPGGNRDHSATAELTFKGPSLQRVKLQPYHIYNYGQPKWLGEGAEYQEILRLFGLPSGEQTF